MAGANTLQLTDENFEEQVLNSDLPVLVDFWAEWCGPCQMLAPIVEELADDYQGKVRVGKLDTDAAQQTAIKYNVQSIPTLILFRNGQEAHRMVGLQKKSDLRAAIDAKMEKA